MICEDRIQAIYVPVIRCHQHPTPNLSYVYGWTCDDDKFTPEYGDKIKNGVELWTLVAFGSKRDSRSIIKSRYHLSDRALERFTDHFFIQSLVF